MTETFVKERKHNLTGKVEPVEHRRRLRVPLPVRQRLARPLRIDPLRPRPQGPLHVRDQRREGLDQVGPARPAPARVLRPPRRVARPRLAVDPRHRRRPSLHEATGGCPACRSATSTPSSTRSPTSSRASPSGKPTSPDLPRRPGDPGRLRRRARLGRARQVADGRPGLNDTLVERSRENDP